VLASLINNGIKFSNQGSVEFGISHKADNLEFYIKDTGIGIPINKQQTIFERFMQADVSNTRLFEGSGLGLSIAKAYVEMLGGNIWVESEEGKGSIFYFTIPYQAQRQVKMGINNIALLDDYEKKNNNLKILIVEDDKISEIFIALAVKDLGKEILKARTGLEAIEACQNNPDIDLIIMDIKLPEMDGYEATRQIRKFNSNVVIIAQSAFALSGDSGKAIAAGCNDYITKPFGINALTALIKKHFLSLEIKKV